MQDHASVTLPLELAAEIERIVASGAYPDAGAVIAAGLDALVPADDRIEAWLRDEVLPVVTLSRQEPGRRVSAAGLRQALAARRAAWEPGPPG